MYSKNIIVENNTGLHTRPAAVFAQTAARFKSNVTVRKEDKSGNAKSILSIMKLGINKGTEITIEADGEDEVESVNTLVELIKTRFGEE